VDGGFTTEARKTTETATDNYKDLVGVRFTLKRFPWLFPWSSVLPW